MSDVVFFIGIFGKAATLVSLVLWLIWISVEVHDINMKISGKHYKFKGLEERDDEASDE